MHAWVEILVSNAAVALVIAGFACLASRLKVSAAVVHALWVLVLLKLVTPPLFDAPVALPAPLDSAGFGAAAVPPAPLAPVVEFARLPDVPTTRALGIAPPAESLAGESPAMPHLGAASVVTPIDWITVMGALWVLGTIVFVLSVVVRALRFRRLLLGARPAGNRIAARAARIADRMGLRRVPRLELVAAKISPMVWCWFGRPRVLLPARLVARLDDDVLDTLLAHEFAHVRRGDHWVRHVEFLVRAAHWWNPLVWWAAQKLRIAEEECCDAWVVWALPDGRRRYADALVGTVEFLSETRFALPTTASGMGRVDDLKRRLTMIMQGNTRHVLSLPARLAFMLVAVATLSFMPAVAQEGREAHVQEMKQKLAENRDEIVDLETRLEALQAHARELARDKKRKKSREANRQLEELEDELATRQAVMKDLQAALKVAGKRLNHASKSLNRANSQPAGDGRLAASLRAAIEALERTGDVEHATVIAEHLDRLQQRIAQSPNDFYGRSPGNRDQRSAFDTARSAYAEQWAEVARAKLNEQSSRNDRESRAADLARLEYDRARQSAAKDELRARFAETAQQAETRYRDLHDGLEARLHEMRDRHAGEVNRLERKVDELADMVRKVVEMNQRRKGDQDERRDRDAGR